jgi:hypothetical protein
MWWNLLVLDEQALLIAIPRRHLESAYEAPGEATVLPAGGPGDLDSTTGGTCVLVMTTDADQALPAATWSATFVRRVPYTPGSPWPDGLPPSWTEEHAGQEPALTLSAPDRDDERDEGDEPDDEELAWEDEDDVGPQSFLEVMELRPLPRDEWLFANELVGKQARGGRRFQPRVPTIVALPD